MDDRVGAAQDVVDLAEVGQIGQDELVVRGSVRDQIDVDDVVPVLAQVADDPSTALAGASGDDDPHRAYPFVDPSVNPLTKWR
jgi:hypothetical protein